MNTMQETLGDLVKKNAGTFDGMELPKVSMYTVSIDEPNTVPLCGLCSLDSEGNVKVVTDAKFTHLGRFVDGIAPCEEGEKVGYVKEDGEYFIEPTEEYEEASLVNNGFCYIHKKDGGWLIFSVEKKAPISKSEFYEIEVVSEEKHTLDVTLFKVREQEDSSNIGLLRSDGIWVLKGMKSVDFLRTDLVVAQKEDRSRWLFNLKAILPGGSVHLTGENKAEPVLKGYDRYELLNESLILCRKTAVENDVFNADSLTFVVKDVTLVEELDGTDYKFLKFMKHEFWGVMNSTGKVILKPIVDEFGKAFRNLLKATVDRYMGVFDLENENWLILPQYSNIILDKYGFFRCLKYEVGRFGKQSECWYYKTNDGLPLTSETFKVAGPFNESGFANVVTTDGIETRLRRDGELMV